jgi:alpha-tubulin suppressor-like RCC1 family protein
MLYLLEKDARPILSLPRGMAIRRVACGDEHCAALGSDGSVYTWGICTARSGDQLAQLGHGAASFSSAPTLVTALRTRPCLALSCGGRHTLVADLQGDVHAMGLGAFGVLGLGDAHDEDRFEPVHVSALAGIPVVQVRARLASMLVRWARSVGTMRDR